MTNTGPADATSVTLTNLLPANFGFVSRSSSVGACALEGRFVNCDLGTVGVGTAANVIIVGILEAAGTLTNQTGVVHGEIDPVTANNFVVIRTTVLLLSLVIDDVTTFEGNSGTNQVLKSSLADRNTIAPSILRGSNSLGLRTAVTSWVTVLSGNFSFFRPNRLPRFRALATQDWDISRPGESSPLRESHPQNGVPALESRVLSSGQLETLRLTRPHRIS